MARAARTHPEFVMTTSGLRIPSPYLEKRDDHWWCLACDTLLANAEHLAKKTHRNKAWYWCFGCTDAGYEQRARAPSVDFDTREITPKFWSNSPTDMEVDSSHSRAAAPLAIAAPPPGLGHSEEHSEETKAILAEIEKSRNEVATEIATMKESIATLGTEIEDKIEQLAHAIAGISAILSDLCPRGTAGLRTLSGPRGTAGPGPRGTADRLTNSASTGALRGPYDQHRSPS